MCSEWRSSTSPMKIVRQSIRRNRRTPRRRLPSEIHVVRFLTTAVVLAQQSAPAPAVAQPKAPAKAQLLATVTVPSYKSLSSGLFHKSRSRRFRVSRSRTACSVYLLENHELPLVSGFALVRTGNLFDPKDKIGLAEVTGMS